ncbi:hypothetical protein [Actinomadura sp. 6N118]|uniref:hypothetical protein n=1 Tax=Actinomadura sp. 6N118 TaxID=3375151 RepID=UPI0037B3B67D
MDHLDVQRVLRGKELGAMGLRWAVDPLRQPLHDIDQALAGFTNGRVRIHP